jgi:hypothetical protein
MASLPDCLTFDVVGELTYGESFGSLASREMHPWVGVIFDALRAGVVIAYFKRYALSRFFVNVLLGKKMADSREEHKAYTKAQTERRVALGPEGHGKKDFMWLEAPICFSDKC